MNERPNFSDLWFKFLSFLYFLGSAVLDTAFLGAWIFVQNWLHKNVIVPFELEGLDKVLLGAFQVVFGLATLIPVLAYVLVDIIRIIRVSLAYIRHSDKKKGHADQPLANEGEADGSTTV